MTEISTETYILYNKTIIKGRKVLVQNARGETFCPKRPRAKRPGPGPSAHFRSFRTRSVNLAKLFLGETVWSQKSGERNVKVQNVRGLNVQIQNYMGRNVLSNKSGGETSGSVKSGCENSSWAFTWWLWNFLHDCDTPWGIFIIVRFFYYYHLNLIYDLLIGLT